MDWLKDGGDLLEHGIEAARSKLLLHLGSGERIWGTQRRYGRDQSGRAVGAAVGPGLGHWLDESDVHTLPVECPDQSETRPGQADRSAGGHYQQAASHTTPFLPPG
jgi:hypothetical protein